MRFRLGKIFNIPIELHSSWFLVFAIGTWLLATGYFRFSAHSLASQNSLIPWLLGALTTLLIFASVLAHELGHAWVARRSNINVRRVTLFLFGGIAEIEHEPESPGVEFWLAAAGPLVNLVLAGGAFLLWKLASAETGPLLLAGETFLNGLRGVSIYLLGANLGLVVFNLAPGFPLDGGRVLRAILWKIKGSSLWATKVASYAGRVIAGAIILAGAYLVLRLHAWADGFLLAITGIYLYRAAGSAIQQANDDISLEGLLVRQVMQRDLIYLPPDLPIRQALDEWFLPSRQPAFFVTNETGQTGLLTLDNIRQTTPETWPSLTAAQLMLPLSEVCCLEAGWDAVSGLILLDQSEFSAAPVLDDGALVGLFSRGGVEHFLLVKKLLKDEHLTA